MSQIKENSFITADCMDVMKELPDKFCDLILTDPPYGIGESVKNHISRNTPVKQKNGSFLKIANPTYKKMCWDLQTPKQECFSETIRIGQNQIIWGGNFFKLTPSSCWLVWDKLTGNNDFADCELAWTSFNTAVRKVTYMWAGFCQGKSISEGHIQQGNKALNEQRYHPTQKPVALFVWCLLNYSKPGDLIIDPFCGSGTTALACHKTGRRFICIDKEPEYIKIAEKRYKELTMQVDLFGSENKETDKTTTQQLKADI